MFKMKVEKNCSSCVLCPNLIVLCGTFVLDLLPCFVTFSTNVSSRVSSQFCILCVTFVYRTSCTNVRQAWARF